MPVDSSLCFSTIGMTAVAGLRRRARRRARGAGASRSSSTTPSSATASRRSRPRTRPALQAADEQLLVRETIRGVAAAHGLVASLAPKPWPESAGNGCHMHFSLWDGASATASTMPTARRLLGRGPRVPRRRARAPARAVRPDRAELQLLPPHRAAALGRARSRCWGYDNREAPVRVPSLFRGMEEASTNARAQGGRRHLQPVPGARRR